MNSPPRFPLVRLTIASTLAGWLIGLTVVSICFGRAPTAGATPFACARLVVWWCERGQRPWKSTGASPLLPATPRPNREEAPVLSIVPFADRDEADPVVTDLSLLRCPRCGAPLRH